MENKMRVLTLDAKELNDSLWGLYEAVNEEIYDIVKSKNQELPDNQKAAYPLLIAVPEEYTKADVRLMVFGQETNGYGTYGDVECEHVVNDLLWEEEGYNWFFGEKRCYASSAPFFNTAKQLITSLQKKNTGKQISYLWNEVIKMGLAGKTHPGTTSYWYDTIIKPHLNGLILKEIDLLKPDFLVFFSGPDYDRYIGDIFGNPEKKPVNGFSEREMCEFVIPNVKKTFRTYHPNYLYHNNPSRPKEDFIDALVEKLSNAMI